jgi:hypothetical protein
VLEIPLALDDWSQLVEEAFRSRVTGHLVAAIGDGALVATPHQAHAALASHERALARDLLVERRMLEAVAVLDDSGIPVRVLKGSALAHTVYPDPSLRSFGDVDVLVPSQRYDQAVRALCRSGARRRYEEPRPGFDRRFGKGVCLETTDGFEIDVHRTFVAGPFGLSVDTRDLFGTSAEFVVGGRALHCLDPEARFVHACFHVALGHAEPRVVSLRDVAQVLLHTPLDGDRVRKLCVRWRCAAVVRRAVELTSALLAVDLDATPAHWVLEARPSSFERRALRSYTGPDRTYASQVVAGIYAVRGVRAKTEYARSLLVPRRTYVEDRDRTYASRLRRGLGLAARDWMRR